MIDFTKIWKKNNVIPAIITDYKSGTVLMLRYVNKASFAMTLKTGYTYFYHSSTNTIAKKGETSGKTQKVMSIKINCTEDVFLISVVQKGNACKTGHSTCFYTDVFEYEEPEISKRDKFGRLLLDNEKEKLKDKSKLPKEGHTHSHSHSHSNSNSFFKDDDFDEDVFDENIFND